MSLLKSLANVQMQREKKYSCIISIKDSVLLGMTLKGKFSKDKLSHRTERHNSKNAFLKMARY